MSTFTKPELLLALERVVLPTNFRRLDRSFPDQRWVKTSDGWVSARGDVFKDPFTVVTRDRSHFSWLEWINGGRTPRGTAFLEAARRLAERVGVKLPERALDLAQVRACEEVERAREALTALERCARDGLAGRDAAATRLRLARLGLDAEAGKDLGVGHYSTPSAIRAALRPELHPAAQAGGLLDERLAGCLVVPWRDAWGRTLALLAYPGDGRPALQVGADPLLSDAVLHLDRARQRGEKHLVLLDDLLVATILQGRGEGRVVASPALPLSPERQATLAWHETASLTVCVPNGQDRRLEGLEGLMALGLAVHVAELPADPPLLCQLERDRGDLVLGIMRQPRSLALHRLEPHLVGLTPESPAPVKEHALEAARAITRALGRGPVAGQERRRVLDRLTAATGERYGRLRRLLRPSRAQPRESEYRMSPAGVTWIRRASDGQTREVFLSNFHCRIVAEVVEDDGREEVRWAELVVLLEGEERRLRVPTRALSSLRWVTDELGSRARVAPSRETRRRLLDAIQEASGTIPVRRVHTHLGWRSLAGRWIYVHAGGALDFGGVVAGIDVSLDPPLDRFHLPPPPVGTDLVEAIRVSLRFLDLAPRSVTLPLYAAVWQAALGGPRLEQHMAADSPAAHELADLLQRHWGAEATPVTLDELRQSRAYRSGADLMLVLALPPRVRAGAWQRVQFQSSLVVLGAPARTSTLRLGKHPLPTEGLGQARLDAAAGRYAQAVSAFVAWLAGPEGGSLREKVIGPRRRAVHDPGEDASEERLLGLTAFLQFARAAGALSEVEYQTLLVQARSARPGNELERVLALLRTSLSSGQAHLAGVGGGPPEGEPLGVGWRVDAAGSDGCSGLLPRGTRIGWLVDQEVLLDPEATHGFLIETAGREGLPRTPVELCRWLAAAGLTRQGPSSRKTTCVRETLEGRRRSVAALRSSTLVPSSDGEIPHVADVEAVDPLLGGAA